jgi:VanZ family protein
MKRVFSIPFVRYWLPALIMLLLIRIESTTFFGGTSTGLWLMAFLKLFSIHISFDTLEVLNFALRKAGHITGYAMLSFLAFRAMRGTFLFLKFGFAGWRSSHAYEPLRRMGLGALWQWQWAAVGFGVAALTAIADEIHQMSLPGRTGTPRDMILDSTAALAAQILTYFTARWIWKRRAAQVPEPATVR